jgi:PTS system cellobiose-specific IIC component
MSDTATNVGEPKKSQAFFDKFAEVSAKIGNQVHLKSLRDAFATICPLYILAGVATLINNVVLPLFLSGDALTSAKYWGNSLTQGTLNIAAIVLCGLIGYCLAKNKHFDNAIGCVVMSISALVTLMPQTVTATLTNASALTGDALTSAQSAIASSGLSDLTVSSSGAVTANVSSAFISTNTGTNGLFGGILIGLLATTLFIKFSDIKQLRVNLGEGVPPAVAESFNTLIPMMLSLSIFALLSAVLHVFFSTDLISLIKVWIQTPLMGINTSLAGVLIIYTLGNLLFCLGIHQSTITGALAEPLLTILITDNMATYAAGGTIPVDHYMNMQIINTFALIGGSGCTLMLLIDTFLFSKSKTSKTVGKLAIAPGIFNINEPVIYGYPIVFNLPLMIPFVLIPDIFIAATYGLTCAGLISPCVVLVPWTTPVFISGFLATAGDIRAVIWQVVEVALGMAIYLPFMKVNEKLMAKQAVIEETTEAVAVDAQ